MTDLLAQAASLGAADSFYALVALTTAVLLLTSIAFAGMTLRLRVRSDRRAERWARLEATWEPLILEVLAGAAEIAALEAAVDDEDRLPFLSFLLRYHRRVSGAERETLRELARPHLPLLRGKLRSRSAETRARAVQTLAALGLPEHADAVVEALDDESPIVVMIAARAVFQKRLSSAFGEVLARLDDHPLWSHRLLANLLVMGGGEVTPLLRELAADEKRSTRDRAVALDALTELHDLPAVDIAARILGGANDRELLATALHTIGRLGVAERAPLARAFLGSADPVLREAAARALGTLGAHDDVDGLTELLEDESAWVALESARALRELGAGEILLRIASGADPEAAIARQVLSETRA